MLFYSRMLIRIISHSGCRRNLVLLGLTRVILVSYFYVTNAVSSRSLGVAYSVFYRSGYQSKSYSVLSTKMPTICPILPFVHPSPSFFFNTLLFLWHLKLISIHQADPFAHCWGFFPHLTCSHWYFNTSQISPFPPLTSFLLWGSYRSNPVLGIRVTNYPHQFIGNETEVQLPLTGR